jgi:hypothetical protein
VTTSAAIVSPSTADIPAVPLAGLVLRAGAALCFIGHGAFGFITKAAWLPYFGVTGIPESVAWQLMPWIGAVDVLAGMAVLFAPRRLPLLYMVIWGAWTALLRPLAGEPALEALERAGNFGVPLAFLLLYGTPQLSRQDLWSHLDEPRSDAKTLWLVRHVLRWTTVLLLAGHGALGVMGKEMLTAHYAAIGLPATSTALIGGFELALAAAIAIRPAGPLLVFVAAWKLSTESLFFFADFPIWEVIERAGSYAAPLALAVLSARNGAARTARSE